MSGPPPEDRVPGEDVPVDGAAGAAGAADAALDALGDEDAWLPPALLKAVWADPAHLPEIMALFAVRHLGTGAERVARKLREEQPDAHPATFDRHVVVRGTRTSVAEGTCIGGPFVVIIPVAFCAALLAQAGMVLQLAALHGRDPRAETRAADLLVLQGAYPDQQQAARAIAAVRDGEPGGSHRVPRGQRLATLARMAAILGITQPDEGHRVGRVRQVLTWVGITLFVVVGLFLPFIWLPAMAWSYQRATPRLGRRAVRFYAATSSAAEATGQRIAAGRAPRREGEAVEPLGLLGVLRTLAAVVLPLGALAFVLLADVRFGESNLAAAGLWLVVGAQVGALLWFLAWWWRRRRRRKRGA
ncbi:hypothetical protein [Yinghuangia seranimata]|uniref:hypothetical protein n=1 Tax=Yinghuangia seranimata TaxID=408067 RepID=UPI00248C652D|nr:hypothetical protein [Yinghuangia seranimata]MDI2127644.1 hypothetical protein [Yinghuangia seranimata]